MRWSRRARLPYAVRRARVDYAALQDPDARFAQDDMTRLWHRAVAVSGDPAVGLNMARQVRPAALNVVGYALMSSRNSERGLRPSGALSANHRRGCRSRLSAMRPGLSVEPHHSGRPSATCSAERGRLARRLPDLLPLVDRRGAAAAGGLLSGRSLPISNPIVSSAALRASARRAMPCCSARPM